MRTKTSTLTCFRPGCGSAFRIAALAAVLAALPLWAQLGDARRGSEVFRKRNCTLCHSIHGVGGGSAPDLASPAGKTFTPAALAALMWNHAPAMWTAMEARKLEVPDLAPNEIADLFAYFYSERYFEPPGDAARGKRVFIEKRCSACHTPEKVAKWPSTFDAVHWAQHMWNHADIMRREMEKAKIPWPQLTAQEMVDLVVYVQNIPGRPVVPPTLTFADPAAGEKLFGQHGCTRCHSLGKREPGRIDLLTRSRPQTLTEFAAAMWNHGPQMYRRADRAGADILPFREHEMSNLLAFLFARRYFEEEGSPRRGERVYAAKKCGACHDLKSKEIEFSSQRVASALWRHGPKMRAEMERKGIRWPTFSDREMADLVAFLNAR